MLVSSCIELGFGVDDGVEDGRVLGHELAVWLGEGLGLHFPGLDSGKGHIVHRGIAGSLRLLHGEGAKRQLGGARLDELRRMTGHSGVGCGMRFVGDSEKRAWGI